MSETRADAGRTIHDLLTENAELKAARDSEFIRCRQLERELKKLCNAVQAYDDSLGSRLSAHVYEALESAENLLKADVKQSRT